MLCPYISTHTHSGNEHIKYIECVLYYQTWPITIHNPNLKQNIVLVYIYPFKLDLSSLSKHLQQNSHHTSFTTIPIRTNHPDKTNRTRYFYIIDTQPLTDLHLTNTTSEIPFPI